MELKLQLTSDTIVSRLRRTAKLQAGIGAETMAKMLLDAAARIVDLEDRIAELRK